MSTDSEVQSVRLPSYKFTLFSAPDDPVRNTYAWGINDRDQIVGSFGTHGYVAIHGSFAAIDVPGAARTVAYGINAGGQIVGSFTRVEDGPSSGFIRTARGSFALLEFPQATDTRAHGVNFRGQVVGTYSDGIAEHGFLYSHGTYVTLDVPGAASTNGAGINNRGEIVGSYFDGAKWHGFLYARGAFATLDVPGSTDYTNAMGINDRGQVVGQFGITGSDPGNGFLYDRGTFATIDVPNTHGYNGGINDMGVIVGGADGRGVIATPCERALADTAVSLAEVMAGGVGGMPVAERAWAAQSDWVGGRAWEASPGLLGAPPVCLASAIETTPG